MSNFQTTPQRHKNMAAIHPKNTKPEIIVRKYLWSHGFRYRLNHPQLPGKPDIVLKMFRTCIFVNRCFAGWFAGKGKKVIVYVPIKQEPELMYKLFNGIACNLTELLVLLNG